jgi:DNA-binding IscR family transcriptional regulator
VIAAAGRASCMPPCAPRTERSRPAAAITLADIVEAVEGPIALTACVDAHDCDFESGCAVRPHWPVVNEALRGALANVLLTQLARIEEPA